MIITLIIGCFVGMANIIPGVSGGTIAVVFNIYDKFVNAITLNFKKLIANWKFLVPLLVGMALGILLFSKMIQFLYDRFPTQTQFVFVGLIVGSIPMIFKLANERTPEEEKAALEEVEKAETLIEKQKITRNKLAKKIYSYILGICIGMGLIITFNILQNKYGTNTEGMLFALPNWTFPLAVKLFVAGMIGAVAMIIPGISGSLLMLIMGVYPVVITAIPSLFHPDTFLKALILLLPNGLGVLAGLILGAKLISWLLKNYKTFTYAVIFGLVFGSASFLIPSKSALNSVVMIIACIICFATGFVMAFFSAKITAAKNEESEKRKK